MGEISNLISQYRQLYTNLNIKTLWSINEIYPIRRCLIYASVLAGSTFVKHSFSPNFGKCGQNIQYKFPLTTMQCREIWQTEHIHPGIGDMEIFWYYALPLSTDIGCPNYFSVALGSVVGDVFDGVRSKTVVCSFACVLHFDFTVDWGLSVKLQAMLPFALQSIVLALPHSGR